MPASEATADCIWNSFQSSGKRHWILTGPRGCGKTTLLKELFPEKRPGLTTWAEPKKAVYLQDNLSRETMRIGVFDETLPGPGNQMVLEKAGFEQLGIPALQRCMESDSPWILLDEIGYLEAQCTPYQEVLGRLFEKKQVAAVVRKQALPFLEALRCREDAFVVDLEDPFGNIGCVIMASGLGKRFGGNKLLEAFHGQPMICRILDATEGIFSQRVVVTRHEAVAELCEKRGIRAVFHQLPHRSDTVRLGLEAMPGIDRCLFAAADQPLLRRQTVAALALAATNSPAIIWRTSCQGVPGSPVIFPKWAFSQLQTLPEGAGGRAVIQKYPQSVRSLALGDMGELEDVDSREDLENLRKK